MIGSVFLEKHMLLLELLLLALPNLKNERANYLIFYTSCLSL